MTLKDSGEWGGKVMARALLVVEAVSLNKSPGVPGLTELVLVFLDGALEATELDDTILIIRVP